MKSKLPESTIHNNTQFSIEEVEAKPILFIVMNKWRQRNIAVREHPTDPERCTSDGVSFDGKMRVIADDSRKDWCGQFSQLPYGVKHFVTE